MRRRGGINFYPYLNETSTSLKLNENTEGKHLVCLNTAEIKRLYGAFSDTQSIYQFMQNLPQKERSMFEIIRGESRQKSHFDIDVEDVGIFHRSDQLMNDLITSLIKVYKDKYNVTLDKSRDILLFTSHSDVKRSYHVIIDNYCHANNLEAKELYFLACEDMTNVDKKKIDRAVYSKTQQFRMLYTQKIGKMNTKVFCPSWNYNGDQILSSFEGSNFQLFERSLISITDHCILLPTLIKEKPRDENPEYSDYVVEMCMKKLNEKKSLKDVYEYREMDRGLLKLKRLKPSYCEVCKRIHEFENGFMYVLGTDIFFSCGRTTVKQKLGKTVESNVENRNKLKELLRNS